MELNVRFCARTLTQPNGSRRCASRALPSRSLLSWSRSVRTDILESCGPQKWATAASGFADALATSRPWLVPRPGHHPPMPHVGERLTECHRFPILFVVRAHDTQETVLRYTSVVVTSVHYTSVNKPLEDCTVILTTSISTDTSRFFACSLPLPIRSFASEHLENRSKGDV